MDFTDEEIIALLATMHGADFCGQNAREPGEDTAVDKLFAEARKRGLDVDQYEYAR